MLPIVVRHVFVQNRVLSTSIKLSFLYILIGLFFKSSEISSEKCLQFAQCCLTDDHRTSSVLTVRNELQHVLALSLAEDACKGTQSY